MRRRIRDEHFGALFDFTLQRQYVDRRCLRVLPRHIERVVQTRVVVRRGPTSPAKSAKTAASFPASTPNSRSR
ncbi:MAG: hypothetical protein U5Q44_04055 [Dehalococcoidia bacterium]|nr:hypothetical protein [Dehalococcoidia bacterium]